MSGENERERRAYEEPEEVKAKNSTFLEIQVQEKLGEYEDGMFIYLYYKYLDKFHVEPKSWKDLFEYKRFTSLESEINSIVKSELNSKLGEKNG